MNILIDARWINTKNIDGITTFTINIIKELLKKNENKFFILLESEKKSDFLKKNFNINSNFVYSKCSISSIINIFKIGSIIKKLSINLYFSPNTVFFYLL
jgi:hypothetical protein